jgi:D-psicose/D-tagatose/L-ribulose 3-epimerase
MSQIGITTWVWTAPLSNDAFPSIARHIAELGFELVEVPVERITDLNYADAAAVIEDTGLAASVCAVMSPDRDLIHPDETLRANGVAYVRHCIDAAQTLGARNVVGPIYSAVGRLWQPSDDERRRDVDLLARQLRGLAHYAGEHGVVLCIEPLNRFETSLINLAAQAIEVIDRVDHPACGLLLDTFHMNIEERSLGDAIRAAGQRLRHLHACENDRGTPGTGHVPWQEVADACRMISYGGPVVIETFTDRVKTMARAVAIWRPLAPSPEFLAREGLHHLRALFGDYRAPQRPRADSRRG